MLSNLKIVNITQYIVIISTNDTQRRIAQRYLDESDKSLNVSYTIKGHGYVVKQSIPENTKITSDLKIEITLESKLAE